MPKLIKGWVHNPGKHCASTVLSDLTYFYGLNFSEPFCFGLGSGLGVFYLEGEIFSPTRMLMTRAQDLEGNFFRALGIDFEWKKEPEPEKGWEKVRQYLDQQIPVLVHADIYHLDHYQSKTHFPGHVVCLWGYDPDKNTVFLADTGWEGLIELPLDSLQKARYSKVPFFALEGDYFPVILPEKINNFEPRIKNALLLQADLLLEFGEMGGFAWSGVEALKRISQQITSWKDASDSKWCFRWAYQIIEKRGTGGGGFRKLYAQFLREAGEFLPELKELAGEMEEIAKLWSELAYFLKELSEKDQPNLNELEQAGENFSQLAEKEEQFFQGIKILLRDKEESDELEAGA